MIYLISIFSYFIAPYLIFTPLFLYYRKEKEYKLVLIGFIFGLLLDILFNTLFINTISYIISTLLILIYYKFFIFNFKSISIGNILIIIINNILVNLLLFIYEYNNISFVNILKEIYKPVIIGFIYNLILYLIFRKKLLD